ncbi:SLC13 family permease [Neobacillus sp. Marseille-QA0830]
MKESIIVKEKKWKWVLPKLDPVLSISLSLAAASCFFHAPKWEYINFKVLISLFNLMVNIKAFEGLKLLDKIAIGLLNKCHNTRTVSVILILLCFFSSMVVTNDVALLTFVPLTLVISKKVNINMMSTVILQTIAANIGSSLTPMGNPQNLFLFAHYGLKPSPFFSSVLLMGALGIVAIGIFMIRLPEKEWDIKLPAIQIRNPKHAAFWGIVLAISIASIFGIVPLQLAFIFTLLMAMIMDRNLFGKIDIQLLLTFIGFFIFVGNISDTYAVQAAAQTSLKETDSVYFVSIILSQFISNVPASILLSKFTSEWQPLLIGVNIGGLGTLIASLASVISYKLFTRENPSESKTYLIQFTIYNFSLLLLLTLGHYFFGRIFSVLER